MSKQIEIFNITDPNEQYERVIVEYEGDVIADVSTDYETPEDNTVTRLGLVDAFEQVARYNADFVDIVNMTVDEYEMRNNEGTH